MPTTTHQTNGADARHGARERTAPAPARRRDSTSCSPTPPSGAARAASSSRAPSPPSAPASRATRAASCAAPPRSGRELARVAAGRSRAGARQGRPALRRPGVGAQLAAAPRDAGLPGGRRDRRRRDLRRAARLADRAPGALRREQRPRRAGADELPVVQPGRAARDRRRGRRQPRARRAALRRRRLVAAAAAAERRHRGLRGRRQPRRLARARSCCAPRSSS